MKNIIQNILVIFIFSLFNSSLIYSQPIGNGELIFTNKSSNQIAVNVYPASSIFNGNYEYNLNAYNRIDPDPKYQYIFPTETYYLNQNEFKTANFDRNVDKEGCDFSLGFGMYRIDINNGTYWMQLDMSDANFGNANPNYRQKIRIEYYADNDVRLNFIDYDYSEFPWVNIENQETVSVWYQNGIPTPPTIVPSKGDFTDAIISDFHNWPLNATNYGASGHLFPELFLLNLRISYHNTYLDVSANNPLFCSNFKIDDGFNFYINGGQSFSQFLKISGVGNGIITGSNTHVYISEQTRIYLESGAYIQSYGTYFNSNNPSVSWWGIDLLEPGVSSINNCEFRNAIYSIRSIANLDKNFEIENNNFYVNYNNGEANVIRGANKLTISNNTYHLSPNPNLNIFAIDIINYANSEEENNVFNGNLINITGNNFIDGNCHIGISDISSLIPVYIKDNHFGNAAVNISCTSVTGDFVRNTVDNECTNGIFTRNAFDLKSSEFNILSNNIKSIGNNFEMINNSNIQLGPLPTQDGELIWAGGMNSLSSSEQMNIYSDFNDLNLFVTDNGRNSFLIYYGQWFLYGRLNIYGSDYYARNNCWYLNDGGIQPNNYISLHNFDNQEMTVHSEWYPPFSECFAWDEQITNRIITDRGNNIIDTVLTTKSSNNPPQTVDVSLYGSGYKNLKNKNYSASILNFKNLINNYPNSKFLEKSIYKLYENYISTDTNHNQGWRNVIFGDLKNYFEAKIQQYDTNENFVNLAFEFFLKCSIKKKGYQLAMDGYQFIAENSPSAIERLMASINYIDVEGLLQGSGEGQKDDNENELTSDRNGKPIKDILFASYTKIKKSAEKREKSDLLNSNDVAKTKSEFDKKHTYDKKLENRAKENINISSSLSKKERRERIQKDLMLLTQRDEYSGKTVNKNNIEPIKYELSQNYPNPFNPVTNIKYQIQKTGLVTLRIYDIIGREIKTIVNEIKNPGSYIVTFNGSEFSSGVYFYRIQSGDFVQVKKMLLIK